MKEKEDSANDTAGRGGLENAPTTLLSEFKSLCSSGAFHHSESLAARLRRADERVFRLKNHLGNYYLYAKIHEAFCIDHPNCDRLPTEEKAHHFNMLYEALDVVIQRLPESLPRDVPPGGHGHCAWSEYFNAYEKHLALPYPQPALKAFQERLISTYDLPRDDETLLDEARATQDPKQLYEMASYAAIRHFPHSFAYAVAQLPILDIFDFLDKRLYPDIDRNVVEKALDGGSVHGMSPLEYMTLCGHLSRCNGTEDMMRDMARRVVRPALMHMALDGARLTEENVETLGSFLNDDLTVNFLSRAVAHGWLRDGVPPSEIMQRFEQLSRTWHHPAIRFAPRDMYVSPQQQAWANAPEQVCRPLLPEPYHTKDSLFTIRSYTKKSELDFAHKQQKICIDTYWPDCLSGKSHILAVEAPDGTLLSNVELQFKPQEYATGKRPYVTIGNHKLVAMQHEGKRIGGIEQEIRSGPLHEALIEWMCAVESGTGAINTDLADIEVSEEQGRHINYRLFIENTGYFPNKANIDRAFQEYKKIIRGGSTGETENGRIVYPPNPPQLISGCVKTPEGRPLSFRDMNAREWLHASGILEFFAGRSPANRYCLWPSDSAIGVAITRELERPLTASLPGPTTSAQRAHAFNAATLTPSEARGLRPREKAAYEARLREKKDSARHFVR